MPTVSPLWIGRARIAAIVLAAACLGAQLVTTYSDVTRFAGTDLRARILGIRHTQLGHSPYFATQTLSTPDTLWDPNRPTEVSRCTYTPTLLALYSPTANLTYDSLRTTWWAIEWLALLAALALFASPGFSDRRQTLFVVLSVCLFAGSYFWRLHVERGQYYVFVVFLMALASNLYSRSGLDFGAGFFLGIAVSIRPTVAAVAAPMFLARQWSALLGLATGSIAFVLLGMHFAGWNAWSEFIGAVQLWEDARLGSVQLDFPYRHTRTFLEGREMTLNMPPLTGNTSVSHLLHKLHFGPAISKFGGKLLCVAAMAYITLFPFRLDAVRKRYSDVRMTTATAFLLVCVADFAAPIRYGYADIMWLAPFAVSFPILSNRREWGVAAFMLAGLVLTHHATPLRPDINTMLRSLLVGGSLIILILFRRNQHTTPKYDSA